MKRLIELIIKALIRGLLYSLGFALVGGVVGVLIKKGFMHGAYVAVLAGSAVAMLIAIYCTIGPPRARFASLTHHQYDDVDKSTKRIESKKPDIKGNRLTGYKSLYPTIIAIEMLLIGFIIEALLH